MIFSESRILNKECKIRMMMKDLRLLVTQWGGRTNERRLLRYFPTISLLVMCVATWTNDRNEAVGWRPFVMFSRPACLVDSSSSVKILS